MTNTASPVGNWNYPTKVRFGAGRIRELPRVCQSLGLKSPLLVTDPGLAKLPMIAEAVEALKAAGLVAGSAKRAKIILAGRIEKAVKVEGVGVTKGAKAAIEAAGGSIAA